MSRKQKSLNFILPLAVYPFDIMFSFGETNEQLKRAFKKLEFNPLNYFDHELKEGLCTIFPDGVQIIRLRDYPDNPTQYGFLQHEIFHAVTQLFNHIGITLDLDSSDEAYAYLIGYITEQVYKKLNYGTSKA